MCGSSRGTTSAVASNCTAKGGTSGYRRTGMQTATRRLSRMLRTFLLPVRVATYSTPSTAAYMTPTACGRSAAEEARTQKEFLAIARATLPGARVSRLGAALITGSVRTYWSTCKIQFGAAFVDQYARAAPGPRHAAPARAADRARAGDPAGRPGWPARSRRH